VLDEVRELQLRHSEPEAGDAQSESLLRRSLSRQFGDRPEPDVALSPSDASVWQLHILTGHAGLVAIDGDRLLLVRKKGSDFLILPGGKPESNESDAQTLARELEEELECRLVSNQLEFLGTFSDEAAGMPGVRVKIKLYTGGLIGPGVSANCEREIGAERSRVKLSEGPMSLALASSPHEVQSNRVTR